MIKLGFLYLEFTKTNMIVLIENIFKCKMVKTLLYDVITNNKKDLKIIRLNDQDLIIRKKNSKS
jgi:hypothetical protein